jgi:benzil reductase ((S)-benzoin forming)
MRTKVFITGTSGGIGLAIAKQLLLNDTYEVVGIGRSHTIVHDRYIPVTVDLSASGAAGQVVFQADDRFHKVVLINNAGRIGAIQRVGSLSDDDINETVHLNLTSAIQLSNSFLRAFGAKDKREQIILNISSGAGKNPIDAWSVYCATKAGLDIFTKCIREEFKVLNQSHIYAFSVAPGVVDTPMQQHIRASLQEDFSRVDYFQNLHRDGQLLSPDLISQKVHLILDHPKQVGEEVVFSLKDFGVNR